MLKLAPSEEEMSEETSGRVSIVGSEFRGEGNSSLVIALPKETTVLKLKKTPVYNENSTGRDWLGLHKYQLSFIRNVAAPLLGHSVIDMPTIVQLNQDEIKLINSSMRKERSMDRRKKNVSTTLSCGLLFHDYCTFPTAMSVETVGPVISVEIKPKMGFLPISIPPELNLKSRICRFHLVQHHKLKAAKIQQISNYCPLDMFSGCPERMECAILELLHSPQNNLRIFKNRKLIYGGERRVPLDLDDFLEGLSLEGSLVDGGIRDLCNLVRIALTLPLDQTDRCKEAGQLKARVESRDCIFSTKCCCDTEAEELKHCIPEGCVLSRILECQQVSMEDVSEIYHQYFLARRLENFFWRRYPSASIPSNLMSVGRHEEETAEEFHHRMLWKFLVAMTARDCSVMLTLQRISPQWTGKLSDSRLNVLDYGGCRYLLSVGVVDLEPKSIDRIPKQLHDDLTMVNNFDMDF